jgi:hypothetical protein
VRLLLPGIPFMFRKLMSDGACGDDDGGGIAAEKCVV